MSADAQAQRRSIWGRRLSRPLRPNQQALMEGLFPQLQLTLPQQGMAAGSLDPYSLFQPKLSSMWLEIGFGGGEHLAAQAAAHPDTGVIGVEPFLNGVASAVGHVDKLGVAANVRLVMDDARLLMAALPDRSLDRAFILFPDPWPKLRHHKRRMVSTPTLDHMARLLKPGSELRLASDDSGYVTWMLEHTLRHPDFTWTAKRPDDWRERPADWPATRYEQKARAKGIQPAFLIFTRN